MQVAGTGTLMKSSRRDILNCMAEHEIIIIIIKTLPTFHPKQVLFLLWGLVQSLIETEELFA